MKDLHTLLNTLSIESGAVVPETGLMGEAVVHHMDDNPGLLTAEIATATDAGDVAEQMGDIASQAESLADQGDTVTAELSAESLHRQFHMVAKARGIQATAESFESAGSDAGRLRGLGRDARRAEENALTIRSEIMDFSSEGKIMEFLRRDKAKLETANKGLDEAIHLLTPIASKLKEGGVILKHDGFRRFLTREGKELTDLDAGIKAQSQLLEHAHGVAMAGLAEAEALAKKLIGSGVKAAIESIMHGKHFNAAASAATSKGGLMGNYSIVAKDKSGKFTGLSVPVFSRVNENSFSKMGAAKGVGVATLGMVIGAVRHSMINSALGKDGHRYAHAANNAFQNANDVAAVKKGVDKYQAHVNSSKLKSAATYQEVVSAAEMVKGYSKFTQVRVNMDDFESSIKAARANTATLSAEEKSDLKGICSALEDAAGRLAGLESCVYEHAVYTTNLMATLIKAVVDKIE